MREHLIRQAVQRMRPSLDATLCLFSFDVHVPASLTMILPGQSIYLGEVYWIDVSRKTSIYLNMFCDDITKNIFARRSLPTTLQLRSSAGCVILNSSISVEDYILSEHPSVWDIGIRITKMD